MWSAPTAGVEATRIDGRWWHVTTPLYAPRGEGSGAPAGLVQPSSRGRSGWWPKAVFTTADHRIELRPAVTGEPVRVRR